MSQPEYPNELRYTAEHEWVRAVDNGNYRVGVTWFAQKELGDVVYVSLPALGDQVWEGTPCGEVESTKSVGDLYAPLSGEIVAVNEALESTPKLVNDDPYGQGWFLELKAEAPERFSELMDSAAYQGLIG